MSRKRSRRDPVVVRETTEYLIVGVLLIVSSVWILANLGNIYLWGDEAQTALIAKTVLHHGIPLGYDGKNYFSAQMGAEYGKDFIWKWHPWFPFYLLAGFFAVFGTSTFVARLPFALLGIATVVLTYYFAASMWKSRLAGVLSASILLVCVPFLLLIRQCRYYSPDIFFSTLSLYAYFRLIEGRRHSGPLLALSTLLLFHTHFVQSAVVLATIIVHSVVSDRKAMRSVLIVSGIIVLLGIPWAIWFSGLEKEIAAYGSLTARTILLGKFMVAQTFKYIFPPLILILPIAVYANDRLRHTRDPGYKLSGRDLSLVLIFALFMLAAYSLSAQSRFFRYLGPLIPPACVLMGYMVKCSVRIHPAVALLTIGLLAWSWRVPDYLYEITHDYDGPIEGIVKYINAHADSDDVVAANLENLPIAFYTGLKVIGPMSGEDQSPAYHADWVVLRRCVYADNAEFTANLLRLPQKDYEVISLPYPDLQFENRENMEEHRFRTVTNGLRVIILRRRVE